MSQFEVIKDIGESMKVLFEESFKASGFTTVNISVEKPKKDNIKNLPTVNCYMYHLGFDQRYRERTQSLVSSYMGAAHRREAQQYARWLVLAA